MQSLIRLLLLIATIAVALLWGRTAQGAAPPAAPAAFSLPTGWAGFGLYGELARKAGFTSGNSRLDIVPMDSRDVCLAVGQEKCFAGVIAPAMAGNEHQKFDAKVQAIPIGKRAIAIIVNHRNPVRELTLDQLGDIFSGEAGEWGFCHPLPNRVDIELCGESIRSHAGSILRALALGERWFTSAILDEKKGRQRQFEFGGDVIRAVATAPKSIGFVNFTPEVEFDSRVRVLKIAPHPDVPAVEPTLTTISDNSYVLGDTLTYYVRPEAPKIVRDFADFARGPEGAEIIRSFGLIPSIEIEQCLAEMRLKDMQAGKGTPIDVGGIPGGESLVRDVVAEYVKAREVLQPRYLEAATQLDAVGAFVDHGELLLLDRPLDEETIQRYGGKWLALQPRAIPLGSRTVGIIVHPENAVEGLPLDILTSILTGKLNDWSAVKGEPRPIRRYGLTGNVPINSLLNETVGPIPPSVEYVRRPTTISVAEAVAKDALAIGFVDLAALPANFDFVKVLAIHPAGEFFSEKGPGRISDNYPLARRFTLYFTPRSSDTVSNFVDFITSEHTAAVAERHGLVPARAAQTNPR